MLKAMHSAEPRVVTTQMGTVAVYNDRHVVKVAQAVADALKLGGEVRYVTARPDESVHGVLVISLRNWQDKPIAIMEMGMAEPIEGGGLYFTTDLHKGKPSVFIYVPEDEWSNRESYKIGYTLSGAVAHIYRELYEHISKTLNAVNSANSIRPNKPPSIHL